MWISSGVIAKIGLRLGLACIVVSTFGKWSASEKLTQAGATPWIDVQRSGLTTVRATGTPSGFFFTYDVAPISGDNVVGIDYAKGVTQSTNPNDAVLVNPDPLGPPVPGGLAEVTSSYGDGASAARRSVRVPTFGMSCYYTTSEPEWGTAPNNCRTVNISGVTYSGAEADPNGLQGLYCRSFIAEVKLQGSAYLNDHKIVQYDPHTDTISSRNQITGADGSPVNKDQTLARDRSLLAARGISVDLDRIGRHLLANDTGTKINGYRLDWYRGEGQAACAKFDNIITVAACNPAQAQCP
jgi:3D (Asp-Asp-Asp) domain-containing protein